MSQENIIWQKHKITRSDRQKLLGQKSFIIWFTGLSGSGKSTLANSVEEFLHKKSYITYILDGDNIRKGLNKNLGFSNEDRIENIRRISELAKLFVDSGIIVLTAFISPFRENRDMARNLVSEKEFIEVYVKAPLEICEVRDPKGLYKKARTGEIKKFTGIDSPYEEPETPEIVVNTGRQTIEESVRHIINYLEKEGFLSEK